MMPRGVTVLAASLLAGCGGRDEPVPAPVLDVIDASLASSTGTGTGITELPSFDPASGMHLDREDRGAPTPAPTRSRSRSARMIGILLRSSPSGAIAAVDGIPVGPTPTYWEGEYTGGDHEFTFALAGHAVARYRFTPITGGIVHGRLEPIATAPGAGVPAIPKPAMPLKGAPRAAVEPPERAPTPPVTAPVLPLPTPVPVDNSSRDARLPDDAGRSPSDPVAPSSTIP